ncbi:uncharacterized protein [Elaeis guineensis]|uniref:uncharacterized protein isoform X2 n=1 Tax=Elaeis guineensis var. tenera TaxID=51953 RepID=UPI003C6D90B8
MPSPAARTPFPGLICRSWRSLSTLRAQSSDVAASQARGGLPRFHSPSLPSSKGSVVRVQGDEFWHMTRVLRLGVNDRVELFNGIGGLVEGCIQKVDRTGLDVMALEDLKKIAPQGIQWHVFAAFGTLKRGRADWLIEKCTELGASSVTPLLTERSPTITENRVDRLQRVILAAVKQFNAIQHRSSSQDCGKSFSDSTSLLTGYDVLFIGQRLHEMTLNPPMKFHSFLPVVAKSKLSFLAAAEATPLINTLSSSSVEPSGLLIVGPEGDFTQEEVKLMIKAGATAVGLGPSRLRVETAAITLLATLMLWSDAQKMN